MEPAQNPAPGIDLYSPAEIADRVVAARDLPGEQQQSPGSYRPSAPVTRVRKSRCSFSRTGAVARLLIRFFSSYGSCARS